MKIEVAQKVLRSLFLVLFVLFVTNSTMAQEQKHRVAILGIDLQNDFTQPSGSLSVKGADADVSRIAHFIDRYGSEIDYVALTLDSHQPIHVAHQSYWKDKDGNSPQLFSNISLNDVHSGKWIPQYNKELAATYLEQLEKNGASCTIWPMHCILGSSGWAIDQTLMSSLTNWAVKNDRSYELFYKGFIQSTEHYSIFRAAVEWEDNPDTQLNVRLLLLLNEYDTVIIVGEATDYCVASSLNDILEESPPLINKLVVFTDCMSWIVPDNAQAKLIFDKAERLGVKFVKSVDYKLN